MNKDLLKKIFSLLLIIFIMVNNEQRIIVMELKFGNINGNAANNRKNNEFKFLITKFIAKHFYKVFANL